VGFGKSHRLLLAPLLPPFLLPLSQLFMVCLERIAFAPRRRRGDHQKASPLLIARNYRGSNAVAGAAALALGHQGVVVTSELLQRVAATPATRKHTA
jgi:hypothetical protein